MSIHFEADTRDGDDLVVDALDVVVRLGRLTILDGVSVQVARGETVALLGHNGAGKTTLVDCLQGFRRPDGGNISVLDTDPWKAPASWRDRIGVVLQDTRLDADLTVDEFATMTRGWYSSPRDVDEVLAQVDLHELAGRRVHRLSGGEKRRLDLALSMIGDPELIFLDEPTAGLDPLARREIWNLLTDLSETGTSILLTSHDLAEVEYLADRAVILDRGSTLVDGTLEHIRDQHRSQHADRALTFEDLYLDLLADSKRASTR